jgi:hypothetical protein
MERQALWVFRERVKHTSQERTCRTASGPNWLGWKRKGKSGQNHSKEVESLEALLASVSSQDLILSLLGGHRKTLI